MELCNRLRIVPSPNIRERTKKRHRLFLKLLAKGLSTVEISDKMEVSHKTVAVWRFRLGLPKIKDSAAARKRYAEFTSLRWKVEAAKCGHPEASSAAQCEVLEFLKHDPMTVQEIIGKSGREQNKTEETRVRRLLSALQRNRLVKQQVLSGSKHQIQYSLLPWTSTIGTPERHLKRKCSQGRASFQKIKIQIFWARDFFGEIKKEKIYCARVPENLN